MNLLLINGSPRGKGSNTRILFEQFEFGLQSSCDNILITTIYLNNKKDSEKVVDSFQKADVVIMGFPLYTDAMPGIVMKFIEEIPESKKKKIGFVVQSGFPEAVHSSYIERYLKKLAARMEWEYMGTVIKGGVEGIQIMPPSMTKKLFAAFYELGVYFGKHVQFSERVIQNLRKPMRLSKVRQMIYKLMIFIGLANFYWNSNLKKNGAYNKRFDAPYNE